MTGRIDLHAHTNHSDGWLTPAALVSRTIGAGVTCLAVTDHDTVSGVASAVEAARGALQIVPGIEATATLHGREVHVLGLGVCPLYGPLVAWCEVRAGARRARMERLIAALGPRGVHVTLDEVLAEAGGHTLARPHLARVLVRRGYAETVQDAFDRWLTKRDIEQHSWTPPDAAEAIAVIHDAGGVASIAHPGVNRVSRAELDALRHAGLDAAEAAHPEHPPSQSGAYVRWAGELGLRWTGGSDFHGGPTAPAELGAVSTPAAEWTALEARMRERPASPALQAAREEWARIGS